MKEAIRRYVNIMDDRIAHGRYNKIVRKHYGVQSRQIAALMDILIDLKVLPKDPPESLLNDKSDCKEG